ncbi:hypothetical protein K8I28_07940 [bacterium]|nr:hypothetical protein [bacterium]
MKYFILLLLLFLGCSEDSEPVRATSVIEVTVPEELVNTAWEVRGFSGNFFFFYENKFAVDTYEDGCQKTLKEFGCIELTDTTFTVQPLSFKGRSYCWQDFIIHEVHDTSYVRGYKFLDDDHTEMVYLDGIHWTLDRIPWQ